MRVDLSRTVARLVEARKQLEELEFTEGSLVQYTGRLKEIVESLHKEMLIYEKRPLFPDKVLDDIFLKLCEIALILHRVDEASRTSDEAQSSGEETC